MISAFHQVSICTKHRIQKTRRATFGHNFSKCTPMAMRPTDYQDGMDRKFFKVFFSPAHSMHSLLPPAKSNPYGLRSRDHNFQLPVCNFKFRHNSFIVRSFHRFQYILIVFFVCFHDCQLVFFSYACSIAYFTFCTIAISLLTALTSVVCTFVTCFSLVLISILDQLLILVYIL